MSMTLDGKLVVAISSRALFDFEEENEQRARRDRNHQFAVEGHRHVFAPGNIVKSVGTAAAPGRPKQGTASLGLSAAAPDVPAHIGTARRASASGTSTSSAGYEVTSVGAITSQAG